MSQIGYIAIGIGTIALILGLMRALEEWRSRESVDVERDADRAKAVEQREVSVGWHHLSAPQKQCRRCGHGRASAYCGRCGHDQGKPGDISEWPRVVPSEQSRQDLWKEIAGIPPARPQLQPLTWSSQLEAIRYGSNTHDRSQPAPWGSGFTSDPYRILYQNDPKKLADIDEQFRDNRKS